MRPPRSSKTQYMKEAVTLADLNPDMESKWLFCGIDLAPNDMLESGIAVLDRDCRLVHMDKLYSDEAILTFLNRLGPDRSLLIAIDMPKNLSIGSRWRMEEVKMHPLRLTSKLDHSTMDRFTSRARRLYDHINSYPALAVMYLSHQIKLRYNLYVPFRGRTPQGCRALQSQLKKKLRIKDVPTNLAPSSVLDAMVGAYAAWAMYAGVEGQDYCLFNDESDRVIFKALQRTIPAEKKVYRSPRYRRKR